MMSGTVCTQASWKHPADTGRLRGRSAWDAVHWDAELYCRYAAATPWTHFQTSTPTLKVTATAELAANRGCVE